MNKEEKVKKAFDTLTTGVLKIVENPEQMKKIFADYGSNCNYNHYSPFNTLLLMFDTNICKGKPFQMARGYKQWQKEFNRTVKKGERAMWILAPNKRKIVEKDEETGEEIITYAMNGFRPVPVFELSQTEGEPIPQNNKNHNYKSCNELKIKDFVEKCNVPVEFDELIGVNGYTDGEKIVISTHNNEIAQICTLFHELAHWNLHYNHDGEEIEIYKGETTELKELEAEAVAFMVSSALGIENNYSEKYIAGWNLGTKSLKGEFSDRSYKLIMESLNQIHCFIGLVETQH